jgi:hypothetical protein
MTELPPQGLRAGPLIDGSWPPTVLPAVDWWSVRTPSVAVASAALARRK